MNEIGKILVIIEPEHSESLALKRAKLIAGVTGAHLHLLVCDKKHEHSALLSLLKSGLTEDGYSVTTEQAWNTSLHETIIEVQQAFGEVFNAGEDFRRDGSQFDRLWRDGGFAVGALLAGVVADALGIRAAIWTVAALTAASGFIVATRMYETLRRPPNDTPKTIAYG